MLLCKTIIPSSRLKRILIVGQGPGLNDEKSNLGELYISFHFKNKTKTKVKISKKMLHLMRILLMK